MKIPTEMGKGLMDMTLEQRVSIINTMLKNEAAMLEETRLKQLETQTAALEFYIPRVFYRNVTEQEQKTIDSFYELLIDLQTAQLNEEEKDN